MSSAAVRDAFPGDGDGLARIFRLASLSNDGDRAVLLAHPDALVWTGPPGPPARCRVAVDGPDGPPVGFATTVRTGADLELEDLFVHPDAMRRGIATALVDDVMGFARSTGVARVAVDANPHARAFYESVGFEGDGPAVTEFGPGVRMHRDV